MSFPADPHPGRSGPPSDLPHELPGGPPHELPGLPHELPAGIARGLSPGPPIGLRLTQTARAVTRAFEEALAEAGGSVPVWLILISLKTRPVRNQRELAEAVGIREATLTYHLNTMDAAGLITRQRDPANRRVHVVEMTPDGETASRRLREAAVAFDRRLRTGLSSDEIAGFERTLDRLAGNATAGEASRLSRTSAEET